MLTKLGEKMVSPDIFRRKDDQAHKQKQYTLQDRQEQTDNAQQDEAPSHNQDQDAFDSSIHALSALIRLASSTLSPLSPPEEHREQNCRQQHCEVETLHDAGEFVPVPSEKISDTGNNSHPDRCAQEIENHKLAPGHMEHTGQRSSDDAHSGNEARDKNREGAIR